MKHSFFIKQVIASKIAPKPTENWEKKINYIIAVKYLFKLVFASESSLRVSSL